MVDLAITNTPGATLPVTYSTKLSHLSAFETWITANKIPVGDAATTFVEYTKQHARGLFDGIATVLTGSTRVVARICCNRGCPCRLPLSWAWAWGPGWGWPMA